MGAGSVPCGRGDGRVDGAGRARVARRASPRGARAPLFARSRRRAARADALAARARARSTGALDRRRRSAARRRPVARRRRDRARARSSRRGGDRAGDGGGPRRLLRGRARDLARIAGRALHGARGCGEPERARGRRDLPARPGHASRGRRRARGSRRRRTPTRSSPSGLRSCTNACARSCARSSPASRGARSGRTTGSCAARPIPSRAPRSRVSSRTRRRPSRIRRARSSSRARPPSTRSSGPDCRASPRARRAIDETWRGSRARPGCRASPLTMRARPRHPGTRGEPPCLRR